MLSCRVNRSQSRVGPQPLLILPLCPQMPWSKSRFSWELTELCTRAPAQTFLGQHGEIAIC